MSTSLWSRLAAPLEADAVHWRIVEIEPDGRAARMAPEASADAVAARLDDVAGPEGWSLRYLAFGDGAVGCELRVGEVTKSAVVASPRWNGKRPLLDPAQLADAAFAAAARRLGIDAPMPADAAAWVEIDPLTGDPVGEVAAGARIDVDAAAPTRSDDDAVDAVDADDDMAATPRDGEPTEETEQGDADRALREAAAPLTESADGDVGKSEGQRAIDRLVDRLRSEGHGLETAKLLVEHGGYGSDPEAARALYGKLRALLMQEAAS